MLFSCTYEQKPTTTIIGILLGKSSGDTVEVLEAIPLSHTYTLVPTLEAAFEMVNSPFFLLPVCYQKNIQIESYAHQKAMKILGVYESQQGNSAPPSTVAAEICRKIVEVNKHTAVCLQIFYKKEMGILKYSIGTKAYELVAAAGDFTEAPFTFTINDTKLKKGVESGLGNHVVDFDDHFENAALDWRNIDFQLS